MIYVAGMLAVIASIIAFERLGISDAARRAIETSRRAIATLRDPALDDDEKERRTRRAALALGREVLSITTRGAAVLVAALLPLLLMDVTGIARLDSVLAWLASWEAIALTSAAVMAWALARRRA